MLDSFHIFKHFQTKERWNNLFVFLEVDITLERFNHLVYQCWFIP